MKIILVEFKKSALGFKEAEVNDLETLTVTYTSHNWQRRKKIHFKSDTIPLPQFSTTGNQ